MAIANLLTNKPATASDSYSPFLPSKAVDGLISPVSRWVSSKIPAAITIDMLSNYYVAQWNLSFMGALNSPFWPGAQYNMSDFKLQGSLDGTNWFDMDAVTGNTANQINRSITPRNARYLRVYVTKGLNCNNQVSSIVDFQAFESPNAPYLLNLIPSAGALNPAFNSRTFSYALNVDNGVSNIKFTPSAMQSNMTVKVNGIAVISGQQSQQLDLVVGNNNVTIEVSSADNTMKTTYNVVITRAGQASYLDSLALRNQMNGTINLNETFVSNILNYTANASGSVSQVKFMPTARDSNATITINGTSVSNNQWSTLFPISTGQNIFNILVSSSSGQSTYTIVITK